MSLHGTHVYIYISNGKTQTNRHRNTFFHTFNNFMVVEPNLWQNSCKLTTSIKRVRRLGLCKIEMTSSLHNANI